jgi:hypothetical protein
VQIMHSTQTGLKEIKQEEDGNKELHWQQF